MRPLICKEVRLLLPFLGIALLLAAVPAWVFPEESYFYSMNGAVFGVFGFGVILLALAPFGQEFSLGTFQSLLAQPLRRNRVWRTKLLLVSVAAVMALLVFILSLHMRLDVVLNAVRQTLAENPRDRSWALTVQGSLAARLHSFLFWRIGLVLVLVGLAGGLWTTLLFRQTGAALWFTILVPGVIFVLVDWFVPGASAREIVTFATLGIYSIAGLVWGRRMFLEAQDAQWLGGIISLSGLSRAETGSISVRERSPLRTLFRKEIQAQQISLVITFGLLVLHACTLLYRRFYDTSITSELRFAVESIPFLWLLLPWLLGSVAIAEERKLGTWESQLCLPITRRLQFAVKFAVALSLGLVLGGGIPWTIERLAILCHVPSINADSLATSLDAGSAFIILCSLAAAIAILSFFASTLTHNTLHALGAAIVFGITFAALYSWTSMESHSFYYSLWKGPLIFVIGAPIAIIAVVWLSLSNYEMLQVSRNVWLRNLLILSASLILAGTATAVIYQRPWELLMTLEPKHGPAQLSGPVRPAIRIANGRVFALLPDGRLWAAANYHLEVLNQYEEVWNAGGSKKQRVRIPVPPDGTFVGGSNWAAIAATAVEVVALQSDGSLWRILSPREKTNSWSWEFWLSLAPKPSRIGSDHDWKSVASDDNNFMALKTDGTLWGWGYGDELVADPHQKYVGQPVRIGTASDWAEVFPMRYRMMFMKNDGSIWSVGWVDSTHRRYELRRLPLDGSDWLATAGDWGRRSFFLHKDGTLWASGYLPRIVFGVYIYTDPIREPARIGRDSDWAQIAASNWGIVAIKKNGSLVESDRELFSGALGQPSKYSDWLAVDENWEGIVAIAADGTVSFWTGTSNDGESGLLASTRRPLWSLNVLTDAK